MRLLRVLLILVAIVILVPVVAVCAVFIGMNTQGGRDFATGEINHLAGPNVEISGLGGHFPRDVKLAHVQLADPKGVWLTGDDVELRWNPAALLDRNVEVSSLTAADISVARAPAPSSSGGSNGGLPKFRLNAGHIAVQTLNLGPAIAGQPITLSLAGATHLQNLTTGDVTLDAAAANGLGEYHVSANIIPNRVDTVVHIAEPPDGLLGHFAGPQVHAPLTIDFTLQGPRDNAALDFTASLGAARLEGQGTLGLNPDAPKADVVLTVPALAAYAALTRQNIAGSTKLHLIASQQDGGATVSLDGDVALTQAPGPVAKLVGPDGHLALVLALAGGAAEIRNFEISGQAFDMTAHGSVAQTGVNLDTHLVLTNVAPLLPGTGGQVTEDGTIIGTAKDFAVNAVLSGDVSEQKIPSGPFNIAIDAQHLPSTPTGTLTGTGALEGFPLQLDARFARDVTGATTVVVNNALWRSLDAKANLALAAGAQLPTGSAKFTIGRLADFRQFSPVPLSGSITGDFSHQDQKNFQLNLNAQNLLVSPSLGAINAKLTANGPINALAVKLSAGITKILSYPANIATQGVLDLNARSATISAFNASWRTVTAKLTGPASVETKPGFIVHHLALAVNGGRLNLDGAFTPRLNFKFSADNLPISLAALAAPTIKASGTLSATATVTGTAAAPDGNFNFDASNIRLHTGPASSLPAANLTASATVANKIADISAELGLGPNARLDAKGLVPLSTAGPLSLHLTGRTDLRLLDPILAEAATTVRGIITPDLTITGTAAAPLVNGTVTLADGSVQNIGSGLNLIKMTANIAAAGDIVTLEKFQANAGPGTITGNGTANLGGANIPINLALNAANATPISSDLATETLNAALTLTGELRGALHLGGSIDILKANINLPKSLPPAVANLPILYAGEKPPPLPVPPPPVTLDLTIRANNQIFIRGDGLFAELGGTVHLTGTAADPDPEGGFTLIRGSFAIAGKTLQFTQGTVNFTGDGFMPTLDLEATTTTTNNNTVSLIIGGTAAKPTITLTSSPPLPSDEVLSELLFGQATTSLSPFQAASLAAALASLAGVGGSSGSDPLGGIRNALGLDELSVGGSGSGPPTVQAGRYVAPGVYVGAQQSTAGQGTQATVQINLYKGLQLQTATGTSGTGSGASSSIGLTYQFNY